MIKRFASIALSLILPLSLIACSSNDGGDTEGLSVTVTTDALYEITLAIGGDAISVMKIIPDGSDLHDFEPKARDLSALGGADVFIYNGFGLEPWAQGVASAAGSEGLISQDASYGIQPITLSDAPDAQPDPHIWLSLSCAMIMAENIRDALIIAEPERAEEFTASCNGFVAELDKLYTEYYNKLSELDNTKVVTGHAFFAYLCRDFGLTQSSVEGVFAHGEPTARQLAELAEYCRENGVTTVFAESSSGRQIADTLAREAGAKVSVIYAIESAEDGKTYLERMSDNLSAIYEGLK